MDSREIYDSPFQCETSSDEFVCHARLSSLQEMAYNQIALAVWYKYRSTPSQRHHENRYSHKSVIKLELMDCHNLIKTLAMPRFMEENLKKYVKRVRGQTISCACYFIYELLSENLEGYRIRQVDWECFVWRPDGRIDYKSTAIKMLHSDVLTEVQKFAIMSNFCLENEIKIFDLNCPPMKTFIRKVNEYRDPLLFYWICYLKNELHRIVSFFFASSRHFDRLHWMYKMSHGAAFEYFWNRLNAEDQVSFISRELFTRDYSHWHRRLYYNMSHDQLSKLVFSNPVAVILLFIKGIEMPEWATLAWKRCKNWISNEQFLELLERVFASLDNNNPILHQEYKMSVLLEIWNTANDHHKNHAAEQTPLGKEICHPILSTTNSLQQFHFAPNHPHLWKKLAPSSFKFLLKFLSSKSEDFGNLLILQGDPSFVFNFDLNVVGEIFELCLPDSEAKEVFKIRRNKIIRPYFCKILYSKGDHDELNRRLLHSFQNLTISLNDELKEFIESLIIYNKRECKTYYPLNDNNIYFLKRLSKFTNKILQGNLSTVLEMKESYLSSFSASSDPYKRYGSLNELSKLIEQEFVHEHMQELKRRLAEKLQATSVEQWGWYALNYREFKSIFSWCYENEEEMFLQVKRYIIVPIINNIVGNALDRIVRRDIHLSYILTSHFHSLERFLEWYFSGVAEKVISFKFGIVNDPETAKMLKHVQKIKTYEWLRTMFLQWNWPV